MMTRLIAQRPKIRSRKTRAQRIRVVSSLVARSCVARVDAHARVLCGKVSVTLGVKARTGAVVMEEPGRSKIAAHIDLTLPALAALYERIALAAQAQVKEAGMLVRARGTLGSLPAPAQYTIFGVPLQDGGDVILLDIPRSLASDVGIEEGDQVQVTGTIGVNLFQNRLGFRVRVNQIDFLELPSTVTASRDGRTTVDRIKSARRTTRPFPDKERLGISVICSRTSQVYADFVGELENVPGIMIERIDCSMLDVAELVNAVSRASGDVLVLIRGGGAAEEFTVFDDASLVDAVATKSAYRVTGLGHSEHAAAVCLVTDAVASTPTAAGAHIWSQFKMRQEARRAIEVDGANRRLLTRLADAERRLEQMAQPVKSGPAFKEKLKFAAMGAIIALVAAVVLSVLR